MPPWVDYWVFRMSALRICKAEEIDIVRYAQLSVLGVPQELLPKADSTCKCNTLKVE